jgi:DNA modification methylase
VAYLETSVIFCDDNLHRLAQFPAECIDLVYLDPPFFSNRNYEVIWGDEAEIRSFEDRWEGGIQVYVAWMRERMLEIRRVLKPNRHGVPALRPPRQSLPQGDDGRSVRGHGVPQRDHLAL